MSNSLVFPVPIITGQVITADQFNLIDLGQFNALVRNGVSELLATSTIFCGGHSFEIVLFDDALSRFKVYVGDQDVVFDTTTGAGSVQLAADRLKLTGASGWPALATTRTLTDFAVDQSWSFDSSLWYENQLGYGIIEIHATSLEIATARLRLPAGMTLTSVKVEVRGTLSGATMPTTMPTATLLRFAAGAYATPTATIGSATDASANRAAFEADHAIVISGLSHVVLNSSDYLLTVNSPTGGQTDNGFRIYRVFVTGTLATLQTA